MEKLNVRISATLVTLEWLSYLTWALKSPNIKMLTVEWRERERESSILLDILSNMLVLRRRGTIKETEIANRCNKESWKHMKESSGDLGDDSLTNQKIFLDAYMS